MLLKFGVDISRLHRKIRKKLDVIDSIFQRNGAGESVITSTYEGSHRCSSKHYSNEALDLRRRNIRPNVLADIVDELKSQLGGDYFVLLENTHIHIQYNGSVR